MLSIGQNHPIRNKFNDTHFLADIDIFLSQLKNQKKTSGGSLCGKKTRQKHMQKKKAYSKRQSRWKNEEKYQDNGLLAVLFDGAVGFYIMRKQTYESKLVFLMQSARFSTKESTTDEVVLKIEKGFNE